MIGVNRSYDEITRLFTGQEYDKETGLYYMNARYYDPDVGVFTRPDPMMEGLNHYCYAKWNPIRYNDPTGLTSSQGSAASSTGSTASCTGMAAGLGLSGPGTSNTTASNASQDGMGIARPPNWWRMNDPNQGRTTEQQKAKTNKPIKSNDPRYGYEQQQYITKQKQNIDNNVSLKKAVENLYSINNNKSKEDNYNVSSGILLGIGGVAVGGALSEPTPIGELFLVGLGIGFSLDYSVTMLDMSINRAIWRDKFIPNPKERFYINLSEEFNPWKDTHTGKKQPWKPNEPNMNNPSPGPDSGFWFRIKVYTAYFTKKIGEALNNIFGK